MMVRKSEALIYFLFDLKGKFGASTISMRQLECNQQELFCHLYSKEIFKISKPKKSNSKSINQKNIQNS
jgi:hypothetical protein